MKSIPILFKGPMVRAILEVRKTATRRTRGLDEINKEPDAWTLQSFTGGVATFLSMWGELRAVRCPYGEPGDELWVREGFRVDPATDVDGSYGCTYLADGQRWQMDYSEVEMGRMKSGKTYPGIHVPRWVSRLTLTRVGEARPERLQSITDEQARTEGVEGLPLYGGFTARDAFCALWNSINAARGLGWIRNPYVWPVGFEVKK
jgi:hypothetical protein